MFDQYWNFGYQSEVYQINSSSEQYKAILFNKNLDCKLERIQNLYLNFWFRGLIYFYLKKKIKFNFCRTMIYLEEGEEAKKIADKISLIEDMSMLMAVLSQYKFEEYNEDKLKKKKEGVLTHNSIKL